MRKIIDECYQDAKKVLLENQDLVKLLAETLIEHETLTKEQIDYLVEHGTLPPEEEVLDEDNKEEELRKKAKDLGIKGYTKMSLEELEKEIEKHQ